MMPCCHALPLLPLPIALGLNLLRLTHAFQPSFSLQSPIPAITPFSLRLPLPPPFGGLLPALSPPLYQRMHRSSRASLNAPLNAPLPPIVLSACNAQCMQCSVDAVRAGRRTPPHGVHPPRVDMRELARGVGAAEFVHPLFRVVEFGSDVLLLPAKAAEGRGREPRLGRYLVVRAQLACLVGILLGGLCLSEPLLRLEAWGSLTYIVSSCGLLLVLDAQPLLLLLLHLLLLLPLHLLLLHLPLLYLLLLHLLLLPLLLLHLLPLHLLLLHLLLLHHHLLLLLPLLMRRRRQCAQWAAAGDRSGRCVNLTGFGLEFRLGVGGLRLRVPMESEVVGRW